MLSIMDSINKVASDFKNWIIENGDQPYVWIIFFFVGILVFYIAYHALQKEK